MAVTDALALRPGTDLSDDAPAGRQELIRSAVVLDGSVRLRVELEPRGGSSARAAAGGLSVEARGRHDLDLHLRCNRPLESLRTVHELQAGDRLDVVLSWGGAHRHHRFTEQELLAETARAWRRWVEAFHYEGPRGDPGPPGRDHAEAVRSLEQRCAGGRSHLFAAGTGRRGA